MKNYIKRSVAAIMAIAMAFTLTMCIPQKAAAATYKTTTTIKKITLTANKWTTLKCSDSYFNGPGTILTEKYKAYKLTVPKNRFVKITVSKASTDKMFYVCKISGKKVQKVQLMSSRTNHFIALANGTYYLYTEETGVKIKYSTIKFNNAANVSKGKAANLKAKTTEYAVFNPGTKNERWYKIKLKGKKNVSFTVDLIDKHGKNGGVITIYDSKKNVVLDHGAFWDGNPAPTYTGELDAGTYYIKLSRENDNQNRIVKLKWK